jgi:hypothetical protein
MHHYCYVSISLSAFRVWKKDMQIIKFVNCDGAQPANFTEYPSYEKTTNFITSTSIALRRQPRLLSSSSKLYFQLSSRWPHHDDRMRLGLKLHLSLRLKPIRSPSVLLFGAMKIFLTLFNIQNVSDFTFIGYSASNYQWPTLKNHVGTWYRCCLFLELNLKHNLQIWMRNANSVKPKKSELFNFFFAHNLDIATNCESQFTRNRDPQCLVILCTVQMVTNSAMESCF